MGRLSIERRLRSRIKAGRRVKQIKILLADYPHALPESLKQAFRALTERDDRLADDLCLYAVEELDAGRDQGPMDILMWVKANRPDEFTVALALVLGVEGPEEAGLLDHLHATDPNLTVLGVARSKNTAFIEQLCPRRRELVNPTEDGILAAFCEAIRVPCATEEG